METVCIRFYGQKNPCPNVFPSRWTAMPGAKSSAGRSIGPRACAASATPMMRPVICSACIATAGSRRPMPIMGPGSGWRTWRGAPAIRMTPTGVSRMRARCAWPMTRAGGWSAGRVRALPPRGRCFPRSCGKPGPVVARSAAGKAGSWNSGMTATASLKCACRTARFDPIIMKETLVCLRGFWMTASCAWPGNGRGGRRRCVAWTPEAGSAMTGATKGARSPCPRMWAFRARPCGVWVSRAVPGARIRTIFYWGWTRWARSAP